MRIGVVLGGFMDLLGSLVAFAISLLAYKALKVTGYKIFLYLFLGFSLLGIGSMGRGMITLALLLLPPHGRPPVLLISWVNLMVGLLRLLAYLSIALGYTLQAKGAYAPPVEGLALLIPLYLSHPLLEAANSFITLYLVFQALVVYLENRLHSSLGIFLGFALLWASHFTALLVMLRALPLHYLPLANLIYWASFAPFLSVLLTVVRAR